MSALGTALRFADGLLTFAGDIVCFFGAYSIMSSGNPVVFIAGAGIAAFGQALGAYSMRFADKKKLLHEAGEGAEAIGRHFSYPGVMAAAYFLTGNKFALALLLSSACTAGLRALATAYKAHYAEDALSR
jgi:hypothetical protein